MMDTTSSVCLGESSASKKQSVWIAFSLLLTSSLRAVQVHAWKAWVPRLLTSVYLLEIVVTLRVARACVVEG